MSAAHGAAGADKAKSLWREIVGEPHFSDDPAALAALAPNASAFAPRELLALLRPADAGQVARIVRVAREHGVPLYPTSTGRNWGLGSRQPVQGGCALLDLSRLDRIREVDERGRYAVVEPGVTQAALAAHLAAHAPAVAANVTGSSPRSSVLGNLLERGTGFRRHRVDEVRGLEVVLGTGELVRTGLWAGEGGRQLHHYRTGFGPGLDTLFTQSNLGVVTAAVVDLVPRQEDFRLLMFSFPDGALSGVVDRVRELFLQGTLRSIVHVFNDKRILTLSRSDDVATWTGVTAVDGTRAQVALAVQEARAALEGPAGARLTAVDRAAAAAPDADPMVAGLYAVHSGEPSTMFLEGMYQSVPGIEVPADVDDLDGSGLGYLACMPVVAVDGPTVVELVDRIEGTCAEFGLVPAIAVNPTGPDYLETVVNLYFDRRAAGEAENAHACNAELHRRLYEDGFRFYRADIENLRRLTERDTAPWGAIGLIKQALDPAGILAPGRYCPS